ncbi:head GIN domain-containing protein [Aquimarina litoralis]
MIILSMLFIISCDTENALDCFQRTGDIVRQEVEVSDFSRILVNENVEMVLKQEEQTSVVIESGDNLLNEVSAIVEGDQLILSNTNNCSLVRDFNQTKIYVTAPNITEIRSATQFDISSNGVLNYPRLTLSSEEVNDGNINGTFTIDLNSTDLLIRGNNIGSYFIKGNVVNLKIGFFSGTGRFEGDDLIAENIDVFHRGTNKIIINPQQSVIGEIRSTGDVISLNRPPVVDVQEFFTGRLIFN